MTRFTVFTATYNRAYTLPQLYASLCRQTFTDFEWVIVDDASTDNTPEYLAALQRGHEGFPIVYHRRGCNGGKHRATNQGVAVARGQLFFIVDSDDYLPDDSLEVIDSVERTIPSDQRSAFAGVCGLKTHFDGRPIGTTFVGDTLDITTLARGSHGITGDKAEVFDTDVLRRYPSPEFEGERYVTPAVVWDRIAHDGMKLRFFNRDVYFAEYLADGLSHDYAAVLRQSPKGEGLYLRQNWLFGKWGWRQVIARYLRYVDDHRQDLTMLEIRKNLGLSRSSVACLLGARGLRRLIRRVTSVTHLGQASGDSTIGS